MPPTFWGKKKKAIKHLHGAFGPQNTDSYRAEQYPWTKLFKITRGRDSHIILKSHTVLRSKKLNERNIIGTPSSCRPVQLWQKEGKQISSGSYWTDLVLNVASLIPILIFVYFA